MNPLLGPRSEGLAFFLNGTRDPDPDPIGGNLLTEASLELIFPTPFMPELEACEPSCSPMRATCLKLNVVILWPISMSLTCVLPWGGPTWLTAIGPLSFNLAKLE